MLNNIVLMPISLEDLMQQIRNAIKEELKAQQDHDTSERLLSGAEAAKLFVPAITRQTLNNWTKQGLIAVQKRHGRNYYKHSDIMNAGIILKRYKR